VSTQNKRAEIFDFRPEREQDVHSRGGWDDTETNAETNAETNTSTACRPRRLPELRTRVLRNFHAY
jgi:hypothetical protein